MLFADFETVEGQLALHRVVHAFVQKIFARLRGGEGSHVPSAA